MPSAMDDALGIPAARSVVLATDSSPSRGEVSQRDGGDAMQQRMNAS
jgi:hypothetical protein